MDITVSSRNLDVSDSLRMTTVEKVGRLSRYLNGMDRAEVLFSEERNPRIADKEICEVTLEGHGHHVRAKVAAHDPFVAVDKAVEKLEHQLSKLKTKLERRKHNGTKGGGNGSQPRAVVPELTEEELGELRIVKTKRFHMKPMTPEEAVLQMDLVGHSFFFFRNADTGRSSVVYHRTDGQVGLIDEAQ